jgi:hypothetical protein
VAKKDIAEDAVAACALLSHAELPAFDEILQRTVLADELARLHVLLAEAGEEEEEWFMRLAFISGGVPPSPPSQVF